MVALFFIAAGWLDRGSVDGIAIQSRAVPGTSYETVRLTAKTEVPPDIQANAIWRGEGAATKEIIEHKVIERTPLTRLYYEVVSAPLIDDRDAVIRVELSENGRSHRIAFHSVEDLRVPERADRIRMRVVGWFEVAPDDSGGSIVTYEVFTDLHGAIPGWLVNGPKRAALIGSLKTELAHGKQEYAALNSR